MNNKWERLNVNNLPSDIAVPGKYQFRWLDEGDSFCIGDTAFNGLIKIGAVLDKACAFNKLQYRLYQPEPELPTHQEAAKEYAEELYSVGTDDENINTVYEIFEKIAYTAFLAGRKSKEAD